MDEDLRTTPLTLYFVHDADYFHCDFVLAEEKDQAEELFRTVYNLSSSLPDVYVKKIEITPSTPFIGSPLWLGPTLPKEFLDRVQGRKLRTHTDFPQYKIGKNKYGCPLNFQERFLSSKIYQPTKESLDKLGYDLKGWRVSLWSREEEGFLFEATHAKYGVAHLIVITDPLLSLHENVELFWVRALREILEFTDSERNTSRKHYWMSQKNYQYLFNKCSADLQQDLLRMTVEYEEFIKLDTLLSGTGVLDPLNLYYLEDPHQLEYSFILAPNETVATDIFEESYDLPGVATYMAPVSRGSFTTKDLGQKLPSSLAHALGAKIHPATIEHPFERYEIEGNLYGYELSSVLKNNPELLPPKTEETIKKLKEVFSRLEILKIASDSTQITLEICLDNAAVKIPIPWDFQYEEPGDLLRYIATHFALFIYENGGPSCFHPNYPQALAPRLTSDHLLALCSSGVLKRLSEVRALFEAYHAPPPPKGSLN